MDTPHTGWTSSLVFHQAEGYNTTMRKPILVLGILYILLTFTVLITQTSEMKEYEQIERGYLDLSGLPREEITSVLLQGEWEFYPQKLLGPEDFADSQDPSLLGGGYITVPSEWHTYENGTMERVGMGTYRFVIDLPESGYYSIGLKSIYTSFTLFINGERLKEVGTVGTDEGSNHPQFYPTTVPVYLDTDRAEIIIQVGNFFHRKGGLVQDITFGSVQDIRRIFLIESIISNYLSGILFLMGVFMLTFFGKDNLDRSILFFGLLCIDISLRALLNNTITLLQIFPTFPFELEMKIEYLTIPCGLLFFALYSQHAFKQIIHENVTRFIFWISAVYIVMILVTPVMVYNRFVLAFNLLIALYAVYWLLMMLLSWIRGTSKPVTILLGGLVLAISVINEIVFYANPSFSSFFTYNLIPFGLFFFVVTHSFEFSFKYIEAMRITRELSEKLERKVEQRTRELHEANAKLQLIASRDELTGLWNRNELQRKAEIEANRFNRYASSTVSSFCVLYMDLDNFKYYNDQFSHEAGDHVLHEFALLLQGICRKSDEAFRLGGDEFVMLLPRTDEQGAIQSAQRILSSMEGLNERIVRILQKGRANLIDIPKEKHLTCSIGIATHSEGELSIDNLIRLADQALLQAKEAGKNRYICSSP